MNKIDEILFMVNTEMVQVITMTTSDYFTFAYFVYKPARGK